MRADRLLALMMLLKTRGRMTAERLALELEVSERTIYRDLYALRVAGLPVYTERGRGGGCYLHEDFRAGLTSLTGDELAALFVAGVPSPLRELGLDSPLRGAMLKVAGALPETRRERGSRTAERVHVDTVPWQLPRDPTPHLQTLYTGCVEDRWVDAVFLRVQGIRSRQRVAPLGLVAKVSTWYLVWAGTDGHSRVDPVSRVCEATLDEQRFARPDGFDLAAFWDAWCLRQEASRPRFVAGVRVVAEALGPLRERYRERLTVVGESERGWVPVQLRFAHIYEARERLLALGGAIEVISPPELRLTLAEFAASAASHYGATGRAP